VSVRVSIYGCGYVGLVSGACLAEIGHDVICVDIDADKVATLSKGETTIYEPGLAPLLQRNLANKRLKFSQDVDLAVAHGDIQFIAVNTPPLESGAADLSYVFSVVDAIAARLSSYKLIVTKSTVPVGTADKIKQRLSAYFKPATAEFSVASNPEFLKEGMAVQDFLHPDRIIIGCDDERGQQLLRELYQSFLNEDPNCLIVTRVTSAELAKYAANAMLATRISFMNELGNIAEAVGADIEEVKHSMQQDRRIGKYFLNTGCGFGGSCLPKDILALQHIAREVGVEPRLLQAVDTVNRQQRELLFKKLQQYFSNLQNRSIALWGLAFKPETDDIREATSTYLLNLLWSAGVTVRVYDPVASDNIVQKFGEREDLVICDSAHSCCEGADALIIVTEWDEFKHYPLQSIMQTLKNPLIFDGRNLYNPAEMRKQGWQYFPIGRPLVGDESGPKRT
jgi:UDPglucose 6-dehydrogenase